ncbi:MAG: neutral/alkaline non-lysosomal ceramidase N-terminal domain-containing protein [Candidatus Sulfotelmatobacter sp.]
MRKTLISCSVLLFAFSLFAAPPATAQGTLRVGAARLDITPASDPANPPSGKYSHEKLYVRAIVLDTGATRAALIGADQGGLSEAIWQAASKQIATELKCPIENILMSATHTHSGWGPGGLRALTDANAPPPPIIGQIVDAVRQAEPKLQPARIGFGTGKSYLNVNRDAVDSETHLWTQAPNLDAPSDKTVAVVEFLGGNGAPIAVYMDYAMHPINAFLAGFTSADFAGAASRYVEQAFDDKAVALFAQGASGDQNPLYLRAATNALASRSGVPITGYVMTREPIEAPIRDGKVNAGPLGAQVRDQLENIMDCEGALLGEEVIRVMTNIRRLDASPSVAAEQKIVTCPGRKRTDTGREGKPGTYVDGDPVKVRLGALRIGNIVLTSVDAELYTAIGLRLKQESPMANTVLVTMANGQANSGYIPNDTAFAALTFQVLGSKLKPGCAETAIVNGLLDLIATTQK